eukprot:TRINITY_DN15599_c0_g1_i1.p1 TRINITY_DN15599_c0_g1~~TRINITY_DN15599_c0_g1_i1.p1  ORF type:complete len:193 (+),score=32.81 TRINITY_DN15599_c0_g1_i1:351-929(+)
MGNKNSKSSVISNISSCSNRLDNKIVVFGKDGSGKSTTTVRFTQCIFVEELDPTIEDSYKKQVIVDEETCLLEILDTSGDDNYKSLKDEQINTAQGFLIIFSITDRESFEEAKDYHERILRVKDLTSHIPCVIVGNKFDIKEERVITKEEGLNFAKIINCPYLEISAKTDINVAEAFYSVVREIRKNRSGVK